MNIDYRMHFEELVPPTRMPEETRDDHEAEDDDDFMEIQPALEKNAVDEDSIDLVDVQDPGEKSIRE